MFEMRERDTHTQHSQKQSNLSSVIPIHVAPQTVREAEKNTFGSLQHEYNECCADTTVESCSRRTTK